MPPSKPPSDKGTDDAILIDSNPARFPDAVISAMHHTNSTVTCMRVQIEAGEWESAIFFVLPPDVTEDQIKQLFVAGKLFPVGLDADVREHENGTMIELGVEIELSPGDNVRGVVLFLTGHMESHHEAMKCLATQQSLGIFIGDVHCNLLHQQRIPMADEHRAAFDDMLNEAVKRDALIRMTGTYDPQKVFDSIVEEQEKHTSH